MLLSLNLCAPPLSLGSSKEGSRPRLSDITVTGISLLSSSLLPRAKFTLLPVFCCWAVFSWEQSVVLSSWHNRYIWSIFCFQLGNPKFYRCSWQWWLSLPVWRLNCPHLILIFLVAVLISLSASFAIVFGQCDGTTGAAL